MLPQFTLKPFQQLTKIGSQMQKFVESFVILMMMNIQLGVTDLITYDGFFKKKITSSVIADIASA